MEPVTKTLPEKRLSRHLWTALLTLCLTLAISLGACGDTSNNNTGGSAGNTGGNSAASTTSAAGANAMAATTSAPTGANTTAPAAGNTNTGSSGQTAAGPQVTTRDLANVPTSNPSGNLEVDIQNVVKNVSPAVVLIAARSAQGEGVGTGSIITPDGYIITNFHVLALGGNSVAPNTQVTVAMTDGKQLPAKIIGTVRSNDFAVIKIDGNNLPTIKQGSSANLKTGEWVVAIGNALALPGGPTVTAGIVGALGRSIQEPGGAQLVDLVQTSAAINPGNSGGPLLNLNGELVGINTAAPVDPESQSAAQGIGFAISIDQVKPIIQSFLNGQSYSPPYMGVLPQPVTAGLAARYGLKATSGVFLAQVEPGSPAANAGWKAQDVLVNMDNTSITDLASLQTVLLRHKPGDTVPATVVSPSGQQRQTNITFGRAPGQ